MTDVQEQVGALLAAVVRPEEAGVEGQANLGAQVRRLDQLAQEPGNELPPMLRHYLEKRSYAKALEYLDGQDRKTKPTCA